jgi:hypothetical protein
MENASACTVCNEKTHISRRCPILHDVLRGGFYSGAAKGAYQDEEEDALCEISEDNKYLAKING